MGHRSERRRARGRGAHSGDPADYLAGGAAQRDTRRAAATGHLGEARLGPSPYFSRGTRGSRPASSSSRGAGPGSGRSDGSGGAASARLPPPRPRRPALDPINGSGLCPGRWGRGRVPRGQRRLPSSSPLPSTLGRIWSRGVRRRVREVCLAGIPVVAGAGGGREAAL